MTANQFVVVPQKPVEAQWDGLARDIMMAFDMGEKTPDTLRQHLRRCGHDVVPESIDAELRRAAAGCVMSKGTRCVLIYLAMTAAAPYRRACSHRIADARNAVIQSGYVCIECGVTFAAADHDAVTDADMPSRLQILAMANAAGWFMSTEDALGGKALAFVRLQDFAKSVLAWSRANRWPPAVSDAVLNEKARLHLQAGHSWRGLWSAGVEMVARLCETYYRAGWRACEKFHDIT